MPTGSASRYRISHLAVNALKPLRKSQFAITSSRALHDAAMGHFVVPAVIRARGEFSMTNIILKPEIEL